MPIRNGYSVAFISLLLNFGHVGTAQEAPCDTSTQACLNVIQANACLAAYIRGGNTTEILRCVSVQSQNQAREEVSGDIMLLCASI
jgi:hypothetical protein